MDDIKLPDELIVSRINDGDNRAFDILFRKYYQRLFAFAQSFIRDEDLSKDIVQEVFITFWEKRVSIKNIAIEAFLYKMVRNHCLNYIRNLKVFENKSVKLENASKLEELYRIAIVKDEPYTLIEEELNQEIENVLKKLPETCRKVFELSRTEGLMNKEIAERMNFSVKNVEKYISQALKACNRYFEKNHIRVFLF
jgi:RNA polymerase sigma-70 factor (ECF subfamily)